eukprot:3686899-Amphidinium_carterae.1
MSFVQLHSSVPHATWAYLRVRTLHWLHMAYARSHGSKGSIRPGSCHLSANTSNNLGDKL